MARTFRRNAALDDARNTLDKQDRFASREASRSRKWRDHDDDESAPMPPRGTEPRWSRPARR
ncbi:hypothetical protein MARCHEWKA_01030 [Brevundimonas phage vB_BpoS-Marchewka]|uniref:Uncharacterized protein n=1 Tax=Brevundimonas phage vB_BpoS-Marchewka TaxID=2948604 RepID=A0A9E7N2D5_9CAUD|nr:hypothetical protein MARCHEWKA_01030 [Brevundimonas phage vB_BpoS-Marchewka]UTC29610.1 hypothetical protein BAMBUS_05520 [Brevundimonas phage vB_BpoS-Bambus]